MKITIVGAGNIGTQFAVHCAQKNDVIIYTSKPNEIDKELSIVDENNNLVLKSSNIRATENLDLAFKDADMIFVTYPAFAMEEIAKKILPYARKNLKIGLIPGTGGGECAFKELVAKGATVFGLQRVPSVARLVERGKVVRAVGYRDELFVAALPESETNNISKIIEDIFNIKCINLPNYLSVTLTPSNPILHTSRLKTIFNDYYEGKYYSYIPLFYEEWDNASTELLFKLDEEVQNICKALKMFDLSLVKSLKEHYQNDTIDGFTNKIKSIKGFKGLLTPYAETENGLIPDFNSRYFTADFPYGLAILIQIGKILNVDVKNMESVMNWYQNASKNFDEFSFTKFDINDEKDFVKFYSL